MKKGLVLLIIAALLAGQATPVLATRRRHTEAPEQSQTEAPEEMDYGGIYFFELPNTDENSDLFEGYTDADGNPLAIPDFTKYTDFDASQIKTFSDAIVDYRGWDFTFGEWELDPETNIATLANTEAVGYSRRKFGEEEIRFRFKMPTEGTEGGWFGVSILCDYSQMVQWNGNTGYLVVIKEDRVELQRYFPEFDMAQENLEVTPLRKGEWQELSVNTNAEEDGIRIVVTIDDSEVINFLDEQAESVNKEGYVNFFNNYGDIEIAPIETTLTHKIDEENGEAAGTAQMLAVKKDSTQFYLGGEMKVFDENDASVVAKEIDERLFVPVRMLESLGGWVDWNAEYQTAQIELGTTVITLTEGFPEYSLNGVTARADFTPSLIGGRMYIPLDFISKLLPCTIETQEGISFVYFGSEEKNEELQQEVSKLFS